MTRRSPEGAFSIRDSIPRIPREAEVVVSAHALTVGNGDYTTLRAEATARDTIGARLGQPGVTIEWAVHARADLTSSDDDPTAEQPRESTMRHPWQPGTPLPPHTLYATCTATRGALGF